MHVRRHPQMAALAKQRFRRFLAGSDTLMATLVWPQLANQALTGPDAGEEEGLRH